MSMSPSSSYVISFKVAPERFSYHFKEVLHQIIKSICIVYVKMRGTCIFDGSLGLISVSLLDDEIVFTCLVFLCS